MVIIGECLNTAVPAVLQAVENREGAFVADLARAQEQAGADYLDVCASMRRGESEALHWLVDQVQGASTLPLCVDSADPALLAEAVGWCSKPGILNSLSLERGKAEQLLPVLAGTSWQAIGLLCRKGIPATAAQRLAVLDLLLQQAAAAGVQPEQLLIDPMAEMVCTAENGARTVLETIRQVKARGLRTVAAISNVSFNLPERRLMNQAFLALAMEAGLDGAVLNPCSRDLMGVRYAAGALLGEDAYCLDYLDAFRRDVFGRENKRRF